MTKYINKIGIAIFFILVLFSFGFSEETFTITTYYPSPYGSYNELTTTGNTYLATTSGNVGIGTAEPSNKLDVQDGNINTSGKVKEGGNDLVPVGAVMFFNLASCPSGWAELTAARGRVIVGLPASGTLAGTVGTALTNLENRAVGQHTHTISDPGHKHMVWNMPVDDRNITGTGSNGQQYGVVADASSYNVDYTGSYGVNTQVKTTGITVGNTGSVASTNAPYIQLCVCQKQ